MNHTPGPWVNNGEGHIVHYSGDIARVLSDNPADARLLAAAPDLLEALREATRCLAWHAQQHPVGMDNIAVNKARAAIAKATN